MKYESDIKKLSRLRERHKKLTEEVAALGNELIRLTGNPNILDEILSEPPKKSIWSKMFGRDKN